MVRISSRERTGKLSSWSEEASMAEYTARRVKRLFSSTRVWTVFGISAFSNILVAISDDSGSMLPRQGLNLLHRANTMRTKSPICGRSLFGTTLSRSLHCLSLPLALSTTHLTFVTIRDMLASVVECYFFPLGR